VTDKKSKRTFLAVYDYGMGGIWSLIDALTKEEIGSKYPELTVLDVRPKWMTDDRYEELVRNVRFHIDIDDKPDGWFASLVENRQKPKA